MSPNIPQASPGMRFGDAANAVLDHLQQAVPLGCWAVTRDDAQEQRLLDVRGDASAIIIAELDRLAELTEHRGPDAADRYVVNAATALRNTVRGADVVARLDPGTFGVLVTNISAPECELLVDRIHDAFRSAGVKGSIGSAPCTVARGFAGAMAAAGTRVVDDQAQRRSRAGRLVLVR